MNRAIRLQYGALPYRVTQESTLEILLVTSRDTRRWIIPKGWPMKNMKPSRAAAREAYEEAGVRGTVAARAIGSFIYEKFLDDTGATVPCEVRVFPLLVKRQLKTWPEENQRELRWFAQSEAVSLVGEDGLRELIDLFAIKILE
jgi:8-oxo-dGTP pyrophosphatase MutT (NUDIX family)